MSKSYAVAITTTDNADKAATLARKIVEAKLAACVQITQIRSIYVWEGKTEDTPEFLLLMKTREELFDQLEEFVKANHDYDVPEILLLPVSSGYLPYLQWVDQNTAS